MERIPATSMDSQWSKGLAQHSLVVDEITAHNKEWSSIYLGEMKALPTAIKLSRIERPTADQAFSKDKTESEVFNDRVYLIQTFRYGKPRYAKLLINELKSDTFDYEKISTPSIVNQPTFVNSGVSTNFDNGVNYEIWFKNPNLLKYCKLLPEYNNPINDIEYYNNYMKLEEIKLSKSILSRWKLNSI